MLAIRSINLQSNKEHFETMCFDINLVKAQINGQFAQN